MLKMPENKTRKKLRITLCVLYLVEIVLCALPYFQYIDEKNVLHSYSVFDIMSVWGLSGSNDAVFKYSLFMPIFFIIPIAGFFFCALDKERNMKNIVSIICCLLGVLSILTMVSYTISLASVIALLLYILICSQRFQSLQDLPTKMLQKLLLSRKTQTRTGKCNFTN